MQEDKVEFDPEIVSQLSVEYSHKVAVDLEAYVAEKMLPGMLTALEATAERLIPLVLSSIIQTSVAFGYLYAQKEREIQDAGG
jgi:uncharacterized membrane protein